MQTNLTQLQYQQLQIQQQQQRLANMMQQKRGYPPPVPPQQQQQAWDDGFNKQQQLFQLQQQRMLNKDAMRPPILPPSHVQPPPVTPAIVPVISTPPATTTTKATPVKTELQKKNLQQYEARDDAYQDVLNLQHKRHIELAQNKKRAIELASLERRNRMQPNGPIITFGPGYQGYGNGKTGMRTRIRFPHDKKKKREFKL